MSDGRTLQKGLGPDGRVSISRWRHRPRLRSYSHRLMTWTEVEARPRNRHPRKTANWFPSLQRCVGADPSSGIVCAAPKGINRREHRSEAGGSPPRGCRDSPPSGEEGGPLYLQFAGSWIGVGGGCAEPSHPKRSAQSRRRPFRALLNIRQTRPFEGQGVSRRSSQVTCELLINAILYPNSSTTTHGSAV